MSVFDGGRLTFLATSPGVPAGVLTWPAWEVLRSVGTVLGRDVAAEWALALGDAGVEVVDVPALEPDALAARLLAEAGSSGHVVWFVSPDGDPGLAEAVTTRLARSTEQHIEVELVMGSYDPPGGRLLELVAVMDRLRSPGGCPWDAAQTHASLVPYALEEAFELAEAVETGDRAHLREELGDLLLQIVFHARVAADDPDDPFTVDDVAAGIVAKLRSRHPHVFADGTASTPDEVETSWHAIKAAEKARESVLDGVPLALPALARADKVLGRVARAGLPMPAADPDVGTTVRQLGERLLALVAAAREAGVDAEAALRQAVRDLEQRARAAESVAERFAPRSSTD